MKNTVIIGLLVSIAIVMFSIFIMIVKMLENDTIKNILMVDVAWGANNVYFVEKYYKQRTAACDGYKFEFEFKALYPEKNELGTLCFNDANNYKIDWFYTDKELKELQHQKYIKKMNGTFKYEDIN